MNRFRIDDTNLYLQLGHDKIVELSTCFYKKVYADKDPVFRAMFPDDMDGAIQNQYEFFIQRFGGPPLYSERKGHPALRARHRNFPITAKYVERWLGYMRQALEEVGIPDDAKAMIDEFLTDTGHFMKNINEDGTRVY